MNTLCLRAQELRAKFLLGVITREYYKKQADRLLAIAPSERDKEMIESILK